MKKDKPILAQRGPRAEAALVLSDNSTNTTRTISIDNDFATEASYLFTFAPERSPRRPALADAAGGGTRRYAGHLRPL